MAGNKVNPRQTRLVGNNFEKRGAVPTRGRDENRYPVGPITMSIFCTLVIGSAVIQIINAATANNSMM